MEPWLIALLGAFGATGVILWQKGPRFPSTPEELRSDNFEVLYAGQDIDVSSKKKNDELRAALTVRGDKLDVERPVLFWASPRTKGKVVEVARLKVDLANSGYFDFDENTETGGVRFKKRTRLNTMVFDKMTANLNDFLFEYGWDYGGWESPVVKQEE